MNEPSRLRVATYNIHKSRGLDRQVIHARVVQVLHELNADIIALQEVVCLARAPPSLIKGGFLRMLCRITTVLAKHAGSVARPMGMLY